MANKALLVGINKYKIPGADLNGCVNEGLTPDKSPDKSQEIKEFVAKQLL